MLELKVEPTDREDRLLDERIGVVKTIATKCLSRCVSSVRVHSESEAHMTCSPVALEPKEPEL